MAPTCLERGTRKDCASRVDGLPNPSGYEDNLGACESVESQLEPPYARLRRRPFCRLDSWWCRPCIQHGWKSRPEVSRSELTRSWPEAGWLFQVHRINLCGFRRPSLVNIRSLANIDSLLIRGGQGDERGEGEEEGAPDRTRPFQRCVATAIPVVRVCLGCCCPRLFELIVTRGMHETTAKNAPHTILTFNVKYFRSPSVRLSYRYIQSTKRRLARTCQDLPGHPYAISGST
eukprot:212980-Prorocentrum_minimum.AAC.2